MLCASVCVALFSFLLSSYPSGVAGPCCNSVFDHLRNCQTVFQSSCCIFHFHFQCIKFPVFPLPCQHLLSDFLIQVIILGVKWYLTVIFIFSKSSGCSARRVGSLFPNKGLNSCPLQWKPRTTCAS